MKNFFGKIWSSTKTGASRTWKYTRAHKIISAVVILVLAGGGYWGYTALAAGNGGTEYVLAAASQGPLQVTVTGSGQVSSEDTLNVTPQGSASGQVTEINVKPGQAVTAGTIIAELDDTTAAQAVTSAKQDLESANISYQQTLTSSNTSVSSDQTSVQSAQTSEATAISTNFTNIAPVMTGLDTNLHDLSTIPNYTAFQDIDAYENFLNTAESHQYHDQVVNDYATAVASYQKTQAEFAASDPSTLDVAQTETLAEDTLATDEAINTALKDTLTYYNYVNEQVVSSRVAAPPQLATQISALSGYQSTVTGDISSVTNANTSLVNAEQSLESDSQSLGTSGTVPLNVQSAELNVQKAQESLDQAETTAADYIVRAPFAGTIATVPVNQYDQASSGTTIATLITDEEYADLSLNETDAAKVSVGQPVTMTFDALPGVTMTGTVAELDPVGTVSAGVVTYDVKIGFSQNNPSVKPGMTVEATIITNSVANAIQVPSAAVTTLGNASYIQVATLLDASSTLASAGSAGATGTGARRTRTASSTGAYGSYGGRTASSTGAYGGYGGGAFGSSTASTTVALTTAMTTRELTVPAAQVKITRVPVTVGISNDTETQVTSGLKAGQYVVTATQSAASKTTKSTAASATSLLGGTTGRTGAAGGFGGAAGGGYTRTGATGGAAAGGAAGRGG